MARQAYVVWLPPTTTQLRGKTAALKPQHGTRYIACSSHVIKRPSMIPFDNHKYVHLCNRRPQWVCCRNKTHTLTTTKGC